MSISPWEIFMNDIIIGMLGVALGLAAAYHIGTGPR